MDMAPENERPSSKPRAHTPGTLLFSVQEGSGRTAVRLDLLSMGRDYLLLISGGEAHAGAAALAAPESCELAVMVPHKEGPLARECAAAVAQAAGAHCAAVAGIHQDAITPDEIAAILVNVRAAREKLIAQFFGATDEKS